MLQSIAGLIVASSMAFGACCAFISEDEDEDKKKEYPLTVCVVSDQELGSMGEPVERTIDERQVLFCCAGCVRAFERDREKHHEKMDKMIVEAKKKDYPLDVCVVAGAPLGSMGEPAAYVYRKENELVMFCCIGCRGAFDAEPEKHLEKIREARREKEREDA